MVRTVAARRPPTRSCVACRASRPKQEFLRVVRTPAGAVVADLTGRLNGRGAYVCKDVACITNAVGRGALRRALETPVPDELRDELAAAVPDLINQGGAHGQE